jgi:hypothetical protein
MDAGATVAPVIESRELYRTADLVHRLLQPMHAGLNGNPLFKFTLEAHADRPTQEVRLYAAINGEATAAIRHSHSSLVQYPLAFGTIIHDSMRELGHSLDHHQDQIIERAFSQASAGFFFRG